MQHPQSTVQAISAGSTGQITPFSFDGTQLRVVIVNDEPQFVAADAAEILGYGAASALTRHLDDDEKGVSTVHTPGGNQEVTTITESGLYSAILRSRKPAAKRFKKWVTAEVLPSIRKTGQYSAKPAPNLADPHALRAMLLGYTEQVIALEAKVAEQAPAVAAQALLAGSDGSMCITNAAKALHMRPKDLFAWLSAHRWIYKRAGTAVWLGYQERIQSGLIEHKTTTVERSDGTEKVIEQVLVTAKGLDRLAKSFSAEVPA